MDTNPLAIAKLLLPHLPLILKTAVLNPLHLSPNSSKQDLRTELVVTIIKKIMERRSPIGKVQKLSFRDPGIKGAMWISKTTFPKPEDEAVQDAVLRVIRELGDGQETFTVPGVAAVEGEWTGFRDGVVSKEPRPDLSEGEMYHKLMSEVTSDLTVLYFHGGAYFLMDPCSHRLPTSHLAKLSGGRVFSVRYRLAPQNPFPAALVDALVAYLTLLSPPPDALHEPIDPGKIIFCGDSAGGNLALVLLQTLLTLRRVGIVTLGFNGKDVPIGLPAGISGFSPWCDIGRTLPSIWDNEKFDYLAAPSATGSPSEPPPDDNWPTTPRRVELYCDGTVISHPLVSPLAAHSELWEGSPPIHMCVGTEGLQDECLVLTRRLHQAGVKVFLDYGDGMPHVFPMMLPKHPMSKKCYTGWKEFAEKALGGTTERRDTASWVHAFTFQETYPQLDELTSITDPDVDHALLKAQKSRMEQEAIWKDEASTGTSRAKL